MASNPLADVAVEQCAGTFMDGSDTYFYAEHAYPGLLATDLGSVVVLKPLTTVFKPAAAKYSMFHPQIADGAAFYVCGLSIQAPFEPITFIRP